MVDLIHESYGRTTLACIDEADGAGPIAAPGALPDGAATPPAPPRSPRHRSWDIETLDRRLRVAGRA